MRSRTLIASVLFSLLFGLTTCYDVDELVYLGMENDGYQFNDYEDFTEFIYDEKYVIPDSMINLFTVSSQMAGESDPKTIYAVYIGDLSTLGADDTVILYSHGQGFHMDVHWPRATLLANVIHKNHYGVLMYDYRGFGLSEGESTEESLYADARACLNWLRSHGVPARNVILYGYSLGTAPATHMAAYNNDYLPSKLILESPMASAQNLAEEAFPIHFQSSFVSNCEFNNMEKIKLVEQPFCWLHGTADPFIAISNGELVFSNYSGIYGEAHRVEGATHGFGRGIQGTLGHWQYIDIIGKFIRR